MNSKIQNNSQELNEIENSLKVVFKNKQLILNALTHRSFLNESSQKDLTSNERLEFLGDSVLSFLVSGRIFNDFPNLPEGKLTFIRTHLVRTETLAELAKKLNLGKFMKMSRGEESGGGRENILLLANCFEAVLGAIYLDSGIKIAENFLRTNLDPVLAKINDPEDLKDSKSLLQEKVQANNLPSPVYKMVGSFGPDHHKTFTMAVFVDDKQLAEAQDKSKQSAEEKAAKKALEIYGKIK